MWNDWSQSHQQLVSTSFIDDYILKAQCIITKGLDWKSQSNGTFMFQLGWLIKNKRFGFGF